MGDGGSGGDPLESGESLDTLLGKILRIDVDGTDGDLPYAIPADNPFRETAGARPEIGFTGLRNPWRFAFDRMTGDLWIGDVGQGGWEEIDVARAGRLGLDYGWDHMEGRHCFEPRRDCEQAGLTTPVAEYGHDQGCTIVGGPVYRGTAVPALEGVALFGDYCSGLVFGIVAAGPDEQDPTQLLDSGHTISSFGEDEAGEVYVVDISSGELMRVVAG